MTRRPVRIANSSGFYGDRRSAPLEMVTGGPIDVLTGDYLAELTMFLLWKSRERSGPGYAHTFLAQAEEILGTCMDRGIKVVVNAGGLDPGGLATKVRELASKLSLAPKVAHVEGDDVLGELESLRASGVSLANFDTGAAFTADLQPVTANAYLGGWGIAEALKAGADVVICPRVTDASLVIGPAAWWHSWHRDDWDALAGALVAGHIIECGPQCTGGNYAFFADVTDRRSFGFPIAEVAADGSSIITKHAGTGGLVSAGTVTSQLVYEIGGPRYYNPDVVARFDTVQVEDLGADRVRVFGACGEPPTADMKVCLNYTGGYRNSMTMVLTGLDLEAKVEFFQEQLFDALGDRSTFDELDVRFETVDSGAQRSGDRTALLTITVKDQDPTKVGRAFSNAVIELGLASYPGFFTTTPPTTASAFAVYWPTLIPAKAVEHRVVLEDGTTRVVEHTTPGSGAGPESPVDMPAAVVGESLSAQVSMVTVALGRVFGARSGDKGGNANIGVWADEPAGYEWMRTALTTELLRQLLPESGDLDIKRYELPGVRAVNFVLIGLLGKGVAASTRFDRQAKGLAEYLRSQPVTVPEALITRASAEPTTWSADFVPAAEGS